MSIPGGYSIDGIQCRQDGVYFKKSNGCYPLSLTIPGCYKFPSIGKLVFLGNEYIFNNTNYNQSYGILYGYNRISNNPNIPLEDSGYNYYNVICDLYLNNESATLIAIPLSDIDGYQILCTDYWGNTRDFGYLFNENSGYDPGLYLDCSTEGSISIPGYSNFLSGEKIVSLNSLPMDAIYNEIVKRLKKDGYIN